MHAVAGRSLLEVRQPGRQRVHLGSRSLGTRNTSRHRRTPGGHHLGQRQLLEDFGYFRVNLRLVVTVLEALLHQLVRDLGPGQLLAHLLHGLLELRNVHEAVHLLHHGGRHLQGVSRGHRRDVGGQVQADRRHRAFCPFQPRHRPSLSHHGLGEGFHTRHLPLGSHVLDLLLDFHLLVSDLLDVAIQPPLLRSDLPLPLPGLFLHRLLLAGLGLPHRWAGSSSEGPRAAPKSSLK
mmetsp:Transcript_49418/g.127483  ORF Transcript_49418/g.127483 Transcript_49418/m.127483 type:complete len:235 (+) Transcript_49418:103-807(+)